MLFKYSCNDTMNIRITFKSIIEIIQKSFYWNFEKFCNTACVTILKVFSKTCKNNIFFICSYLNQSYTHNY